MGLPQDIDSKLARYLQEERTEAIKLDREVLGFRKFVKKRWSVHVVDSAMAATGAVSDQFAEKKNLNDIDETVKDYDRLATYLENASPREIMDRALSKFGNDIAIAFSFKEEGR